MAFWRVRIEKPTMAQVRCVGCGKLVAHDSAVRVEARFETPAGQSHEVRGLSVGWGYGGMTDVQMASMNASATSYGYGQLMGIPEPAPKEIHHTYSGYACTIEHAEVGAETLRAELGEGVGHGA